MYKTAQHVFTKSQNNLEFCTKLKIIRNADDATLNVSIVLHHIIISK